MYGSWFKNYWGHFVNDLTDQKDPHNPEPA